MSPQDLHHGSDNASSATKNDTPKVTGTTTPPIGFSTAEMAQPSGSPLGNVSTKLDPFPRIDFLLKTCYTIMDSRTMNTREQIVRYLVERMNQYRGGYY